MYMFPLHAFPTADDRKDTQVVRCLFWKMLLILKGICFLNPGVTILKQSLKFVRKLGKNSRGDHLVFMPHLPLRKINNR